MSRRVVADKGEDIEVQLEPLDDPAREQAAAVLARLGWSKGKTRRGIVGAAATAAGVSTRTLTRWCSDEAFTEHVRALQGAIIDKLLQTLLLHANAGNVAALKLALESLDPMRFCARTRSRVVERELAEQDDLKYGLLPLTAIFGKSSADEGED